MSRFLKNIEPIYSKSFERSSVTKNERGTARVHDAGRTTVRRRLGYSHDHGEVTRFVV
jgi:hypothetical protein